MFEFKVVYRESWVCFESSWERSSRSVTNNKWYSSTFQANHFVSQQSFAKILTLPKDQNYFPYPIFSWNFKELSGRTESYKHPRMEESALSLLSMYSRTSHIHRFKWAHPSHGQGRWPWKKQVKVLALNKSTFTQAFTIQSSFTQEWIISNYIGPSQY